MRIPLQPLMCAAALGALLAFPAAQATNVAKLPLKASVLAKPNVIFGMDDSGSMDWEVLLDTSSGLLWWNGSTAWDSSKGKPLKSSSYRPYAYLFPVGSAQGGQLYSYSSDYGKALPPTNEFAWLRSAAFNPLYYDTHVTYKPWAPAYHDSAVQTYANASTTAALAHPAYSSGPKLNLTSDWDSGNANFTNRDDEYTFYFQSGMQVPATGISIHSGSSSCPLGGTATGNCYAGVRYYPATFWVPETCSVGTDCAQAPDGRTLKRYEIKSGNSFPSGRSYTDEIQNFANWFSYYRKRKLMLAGSMGQVMEDLTGLRMGVMRFTDASASTPTVTMYDADNPNADDNGRRVAGWFYKNSMAAEGTPTHATVKHIAKQFDENKKIVEYACQRNSMFIVTDGFSNTASITPPSWDSGKSASTWGSGAPYETTANGTLADLALRYYTNRLRTDLPADKVPKSSSSAPNADKNPDLHINTYAISLGVRGSLWPTSADPFVTAPTWTTPVADDPSLIDDMWHATINGRGLMYLATNPAETSAGVQAVLEDIISQRGAQGGVAVSTVNLSRGDNRAYFGTYDPSGWQGDITAHPIDPATGQVNATTETWSASKLLKARDWTTRVIATATSAGGASFSSTAVGTTVTPTGAYGDTGLLMDYLRGDRTHEGTLFRKRQSLIGAVINSEPAVQRSQNVIYVQSGEGMLHAIDTSASTAGTELWAFVPPSVLPNIGETAPRSYIFRTQLDGSPTLGTYGGGTLLVAGTGVAGRSFYALDVTSPRGLDEAGLASKYKWQFPAAGDATTAAKVGQALGRPRIVRTGDATYPYVVLITSGYNSNDGRGRLWMVDPADGDIVHEFDTGVGSGSADAGLAQISAFAEADGTVRYVYGGDLLGNVWVFDLKDKTTPMRLATLKDSAGKAQPVTAAPELTKVEGKRVVIVGTGRLLDISDFGNSDTQSVYAIVDGTTISNPRSSLVEQSYDPSTGKLTAATVDWATDRGWFVDLPAGEQANTTPTIAYGAVAFVTNTNGGSDCSASSRLYVIDVKTGGAFDGAGFVSSEISGGANSSGVTALSTSQGKIVGSGQDADGKPWEREIVKTIPITPAKNAWREIRRQ